MKKSRIFIALPSEDYRIKNWKEKNTRKRKSFRGTTDDTGRFHTINIDPDTIDLLVGRNYGKRRFFASLASLLFYSNVGQTIRPLSKGVKQA